jgi:hypothetical protein
MASQVWHLMEPVVQLAVEEFVAALPLAVAVRAVLRARMA